MSKAAPHKPAVFVRWHDTASEDEWMEYDGEPTDTVIESLFWLIDDAPTHLVVSSNHCRAKAAATWGHIWHIPKGAIDYYYELDPPRKGW